jgi:hypothetical protein
MFALMRSVSLSKGWKMNWCFLLRGGGSKYLRFLFFGGMPEYLPAGFVPIVKGLGCVRVYVGALLPLEKGLHSLSGNAADLPLEPLLEGGGHC